MAVKTLDVDALVAMDLPDAKKLIFSSGWRYLVVRYNGRDLASGNTKEVRTDRIKLTVANEIVTDAKIG